MTDENTFTPAKLQAMLRKFDHLMTDDVVAVSMLFPPDKALGFSDHKGTVWAMGLAGWHRLKAATKKLDLPFGSPLLAPFGGMRVVFDQDGEAWIEVRDRIVNSMKAAVETSEHMERLRFAEKLLRPAPEKDPPEEASE